MGKWVALVVVIASAGIAEAGGSDTNDVACGSTPAGWDAPKGAIVTTRGEGPVKAVLDAVGEYRTHNMLSHGAGGWVTHSTMHEPGQNAWPTVCSRPLRANELEKGWPGGSQVSQGAIYTFLYGGSSPIHLKYQIDPAGPNRARAESIADWAWNNVAYQWATSHKNGDEGMWIIGTNGEGTVSCEYDWVGQDEELACPSSWKGTGDGCDCGCQWKDPDCAYTGSEFQRFAYSTYQYVDIQGRSDGSMTWTKNNGTHCTSLDSWFVRQESGGATQISSHTYGHDDVVAAANALYNSVYDACEHGMGFWESVGVGIICFEGVCDDAARQVRNCFLDAEWCDSDSNALWNRFAADPNATATSLSPDDFTGWGGHATVAAASNEIVGPYAGYSEATVQWNAGGTQYSCWF